MPMAAMVTGQTGHLMTPLSPGPGCPTVLIGGFPAWRALPAGLGNAVESISTLMNSFMLRPAMTPVDATPWLVKISKSLDQGAGKAAGLGAPVAAATAKSQIASLNTANGLLSTAWGIASVIPAGKAAADKAYTEGIKAAAAVAACAVVASMAGLSDMHNCPVPVPIPPHGPGYVTVGSATVMIGGLAAARQGDLVFEACGGPAPIAMGCPTVMIGDSVGGAASAAAAGAVAGAVGAAGAGNAAAAGAVAGAVGAADANAGPAAKGAVAGAVGAAGADAGGAAKGAVAGAAGADAGGDGIWDIAAALSGHGADEDAIWAVAAALSGDGEAEGPVGDPSVPEPDAQGKVDIPKKEVVVREPHPKSSHGDEAGTLKDGLPKGGSLPPKR